MLLPPGWGSRLLAAVLRITVGDDGIQVVAVLGVAESLKHRSHQALDSGAVSSLAMKPTMDRWSWPRRATSTRTVAGAVLGPRDSGQQRSITVPSGQRHWQVDSRNPLS